MSAQYLVLFSGGSGLAGYLMVQIANTISEIYYSDAICQAVSNGIGNLDSAIQTLDNRSLGPYRAHFLDALIESLKMW